MRLLGWEKAKHFHFPKLLIVQNYMPLLIIPGFYFGKLTSLPLKKMILVVELILVLKVAQSPATKPQMYENRAISENSTSLFKNLIIKFIKIMSLLTTKVIHVHLVYCKEYKQVDM
jgi:hypothetical protein